MPGAMLRGRGGYCRTDVLSVVGSPSTEIMAPRRRLVEPADPFTVATLTREPFRFPSSYSTSFSLTESPISESGKWVRQCTSRTDVSTASGIAFGTQTSHSAPPFDDSYAYVGGVWSQNVEAIATVSKGTTAGIQEVEFLFCVNDSAGSASMTCYEFNIAQDGSYANCYAWLGLANNINQFDQIAGTSVSGGVSNGYKFRARRFGTALTLDVDRLLGAGWENLINATDSRYTTGSPGIGFYRDTALGAPGASNQFGWTDYSVTEL